MQINQMSFSYTRGSWHSYVAHTSPSLLCSLEKVGISATRLMNFGVFDADLEIVVYPGNLVLRIYLSLQTIKKKVSILHILLSQFNFFYISADLTVYSADLSFFSADLMKICATFS